MSAGCAVPGVNLVEQEVSADDFRTHYDLGIGYKEMGLLDALKARYLEDGSWLAELP